MAESRLSTSSWLRTSASLMGNSVLPRRENRLSFRLLADLSVAVNHVLVSCQFLESARSAGVELVGTDANLGSQSKFEAVVESRAGIDHHGRAIDLGSKLPGRRQVAR